MDLQEHQTYVLGDSNARRKARTRRQTTLAISLDRELANIDRFDDRARAFYIIIRSIGRLPVDRCLDLSLS